jgi:phage/plasmid primase-like uncharacterized protein
VISLLFLRFLRNGGEEELRNCGENMILDLIRNDGTHLKKQAVTSGGEYSGPCPFCQAGKDRFRVWPEKDRYWCRQCDHSGDSIQYLRDLHGMSFPQAAEAVGKVIPMRQHRRPAPMMPGWTPSEAACSMRSLARAGQGRSASLPVAFALG